MALKKPAPVAQAGVNFGSLELYAAGGGLPEGDYVWTDLTVMMYQAQSQAGVNKGPARLGVMITLLPLNDPKPESERTQFYSMGSSADKSFAPNPETGKGVVPVPGGPGTTFNNSTNWAMLLKSLYDCGLPEGIFTNDVSVLEGTHVHMTNIPEPAERAGFQNKAATGEAAMEERKAGTVAVVTEIKDDGKPWEGSGGIPEAAPAKPAVVKAGATKVQAIKKPVAALAPAATEDAGDEDVQSAAINGMSAVLEKYPSGCSRLIFKTQTFTAVKSAQGDDMAGAVVDSFFGDDATLNGLVNQLGYNVAGGMVKLQA